MRVTDGRAWGAGCVVNEYSKADPWNCDGSLMIVTDTEGRWLLLDGETYRRRGYVKSETGEIFRAALEPRWHPTDPDAFYFIDGNRFNSYSCSKGGSRVLHEWDEYEAVSATCEGNLSADGSVIALAGHGGDQGVPQDLFLY